MSRAAGLSSTCSAKLRHLRSRCSGALKRVSAPRTPWTGQAVPAAERTVQSCKNGAMQIISAPHDSHVAVGGNYW